MLLINTPQKTTVVKFFDSTDRSDFAHIIQMARDTYFAGTALWLHAEALRIRVHGYDTSKMHDLTNFAGPTTYANIAGHIQRLADWHTTGSKLRSICYDLAADLKNFSESQHAPVSRRHNLAF